MCHHHHQTHQSDSHYDCLSESKCKFIISCSVIADKFIPISIRKIIQKVSHLSGSGCLPLAKCAFIGLIDIIPTLYIRIALGGDSFRISMSASTASSVDTSNHSTLERTPDPSGHINYKIWEFAEAVDGFIFLHSLCYFLADFLIHSLCICDARILLSSGTSPILFSLAQKSASSAPHQL